MGRSIERMGLALLLVLALGCSGGDSAEDSADAGAPAAADEATDGTAPEDDQPGDSDVAAVPGGPSGGSGVITIDGEDIALGPGRCHLEEQPSVGGGGMIELTGQAEGEGLMVDFTRFSEDDLFAGDDLSIDFFEARADGVDGFSGKWDIGTVSLDGSALVGTDLPVSHRATGVEATVTFRIEC